MKELTFNDVPSWFVLCTNSQCPMAESCLRQMAVRLAPNDVKTAMCVMPTQWCDDDCQWYAEVKTTMRKRGFSHLFERIYDADARTIRRELLRYFGYKKKYYALLRGEQALTADEEQYIRRLLKRHGYDWEPPFDNEEEVFVFP